MGYPKSSRAVDHFSIEIDTHGFGEPPFFEFKNPTSTLANTLTCSHESLLNHTLSDQHLVILVQFLRRRTKGELENVGKTTFPFWNGEFLIKLFIGGEHGFDTS